MVEVDTFVSPAKMTFESFLSHFGADSSELLLSQFFVTLHLICGFSGLLVRNSSVLLGLA